MSHPLGAQLWGAQLGHGPEDSWRGFVALEGYPISPDDDTSDDETSACCLSDDVMSKVEDAEALLAMLAGRPLTRCHPDLEDVEKLLRLSLDDKQPGSLGDWIEWYLYRIDREYARADPKGQKRLEPLRDTLREARANANGQRKERARKFKERYRAGHTGHDLVFAERVARMVRDMNVKAVVLTTCRGGVRGVSRWSGLAAALLRAGVPVVVAMQFAISVDAARDFSYGFYDALARGYSIDEAVTAGRKKLHRPPGKKGFDDFGLPVIYSRMTRTVSLKIRDIQAPQPGL